jgi:hypothetical protein
MNKRLIFLVLIFFLIVNLASTGGHFDLWDGVETFLVTESMVLKHSAKLYPDVPSIQKLSFDIRYSIVANKALQTGTNYDSNTYNTMQLEPIYAVRSLLLSAIAIPFYYAAIAFSVSPISFVAIFVNSLIISLVSLVIFCFSLDIYGSRKISFILSLIFCVCSFIWPYHTSLWPQPLQALCIVASAYFIYGSLHRHFSFICLYSRPRNDKNNGIYLAGLGGMFLGLSVFAHPSSIILIPGFIAFFIFSMRCNRNSFYSFLIVLCSSLFLVGVANYLRFGSFTEFGYGYYGSLSSHSIDNVSGWKGLLGLLISPGVGLIFYFPITILLPIALRYLYKGNKGLFFLFTYTIFVNWLYAGTLSWSTVAWSGGVAWGPRYLIPVLPFITIAFGALLLQLKKRLFLKLSLLTLCIAGFYINLSGSLIWIFYGFDYGWEKEGLSKMLNALDVVTLNPNYSPIILQTKTLMSDYVSHIDPQKYHSLPWGSFVQGLAPCPYDNYIFCNFGIVPILLLCTLVAVLAMAIIMETSKFNCQILGKFW